MKIVNFFSFCLFRFFILIRKVFIKIHSIYISKLLKQCGTRPHIEFLLYLTGPKYICIGDNFISNARLRLEAFKLGENDPIIKIGDNVNINFDCHIGAINRIEIGNNVLLASKVFISDHSHGDSEVESLKISPLNRPIISKGPVLIKDNVWIGEGASILSNVTIGEGAIVGANSVVTRDVPPYSVVGGVPSRIIKQYK